MKQLDPNINIHKDLLKYQSQDKQATENDKKIGLTNLNISL